MVEHKKINTQRYTIQKGASLVEMALVISMIAMVTIAATSSLGEKLKCSVQNSTIYINENESPDLGGNDSISGNCYANPNDINPLPSEDEPIFQPD